MTDLIWETEPKPEYVAVIKALTRATGVFSDEEVEMSGDMIADTLSDRFVYDFIFARDAGGRLASYSCFGHIELTKSAYDLFWIATNPAFQGRGLATETLKRTLAAIRSAGGDQVYAETSSLPQYQPARNFYLKHGFTEISRVKNFYKPGDDKVVFRIDV